jgi:hypothetical protein
MSLNGHVFYAQGALSDLAGDSVDSRIEAAYCAFESDWLRKKSRSSPNTVGTRKSAWGQRRH